MMPPWYLRLRCFLLGHRWVDERAAAPVIPMFFCCRVCGKWERALR
jgi:hypothetical protein